MHMNVALRIDSGREGVMQVEERKVALTNMEFKGKCYSCGKYWHKQNKCPKKNKSDEENRNKKFSGTWNYCGQVEHKVANCWEHEANKNNRPKN